MTDIAMNALNRGLEHRHRYGPVHDPSGQSRRALPPLADVPDREGRA